MSFDLSNVRVLHLEPTSFCNAGCPQCARYSDDGVTFNPKVDTRNLDLNIIQTVLPKRFVEQLDKMFMCGVYGDPAAHVGAIDIYDWFRDLNPEITLGMNTNGSMRNTEWWTDLGHRLSRERDYCVFSIDGLEDTNHIYRRRTQYKKIMENAPTILVPIVAEVERTTTNWANKGK